MIVSESERKAKQFLRNIKRAVLRAQAKGYDMSRGAVWKDNSIEVITGGKKCQIDAMATGQDPRGYITDENWRPTLLILDDIETKDKMKSRNYREKIQDWLESDLFPALEEGGEIWMIGTITHIDGEVNKALLSDDWLSMRVGILNDKGMSNWESRYPTLSIYKKKSRLYKKGLFDTFAQELLCIAQAEEKKFFKREMFRYFERVEYGNKIKKIRMANALDEQTVSIREPLDICFKDGRKIPIVSTLCYATNDIASDGKDRTAIIVVHFDFEGNWYVTDILAGRWNPFLKSVAAITAQAEYKPLMFGIEKGGMQNDFFYTIDVAQKESGVHINVVPLKHGNVNKNLRISHLQPYFMAGQVYFNESHPLTATLEAQLTSFDIDKESSEDDLMDALAYHVQFVAGREFQEEDDEDWNRGSLWNQLHYNY